MFTEEQVERAVLFLRDSAAQYGKARGHQEYCDANLRRVKSLCMLANAGTLGEREAQAYASADYLGAMEALENAVAEYETLRAKREACVMLVETWRSQNAARRQGINV
jgi:hypothetical protein